MNETAASAAQLAKCMLLHAYSRTTASSQLRENKQKLDSLRLKILKKLRTASLNSEFTGSYKKKCTEKDTIKCILKTCKTSPHNHDL